MCAAVQRYVFKHMHIMYINEVLAVAYVHSCLFIGYWGPWLWIWGQKQNTIHVIMHTTMQMHDKCAWVCICNLKDKMRHISAICDRRALKMKFSPPLEPPHPMPSSCQHCQNFGIESFHASNKKLILLLISQKY